VLVHHVLLVALQVPLFQHMDDLVLENICDRVKSLIFPKGEVVSAARTRSPLPFTAFLEAMQRHKPTAK